MAVADVGAVEEANSACLVHLPSFLFLVGDSCSPPHWLVVLFFFFCRRTEYSLSVCVSGDAWAPALPKQSSSSSLVVLFLPFPLS